MGVESAHCDTQSLALKMKLLKVVSLFAFASAAMSAKPVEDWKLKRRNLPHRPKHEIGNPNHVANLKTATDKAAATCVSWFQQKTGAGSWTTEDSRTVTCNPDEDEICMDLWVHFVDKDNANNYYEVKEGFCVPAEFTCKHVEWIAGHRYAPFDSFDYTAYGCETCDTDDCNTDDGLVNDPSSVPTQAINCNDWFEISATADGTFGPVDDEHVSAQGAVFPCDDEYAYTGKCMSIFYNYTDSNGNDVYARQAGCAPPDVACNNMQSFLDQDLDGDVSELPTIQDKSQSVLTLTGCDSCTGDQCDLDVAVNDASALPAQEDYPPLPDDDDNDDDDDDAGSSSKVFSAPALGIAALTAALVI